DGLPGLAGVIGAKRARRRDGDVHALGIGVIQNDAVQAHAAGTRLPFRPCAVAAQPGKLLPTLAAVGRFENRRIFHASVYGIGIGERRFDMPDALELPGVLRAVVPLVRGEGLSSLFGRRVVDEFVALAFLRALLRGLLLAGRRPGLNPGFAAVSGSLNDLPEPSAGLRRVDPVRIRRRSLQVIELPSGEVGTA